LSWLVILILLVMWVVNKRKDKNVLPTVSDQNSVGSWNPTNFIVLLYWTPCVQLVRTRARINVEKTQENMSLKYLIKNLPLPKSMVEKFETHNWKKPLDFDKLEELILRKNPFQLDSKILKEQSKNFELYDLKLITSESHALKNWKNPNNKDLQIMYLGKNDKIHFPGSIITEKTILFADFGIGSDTPFALDYHENLTKPSVILLYWGENPETDNRWIKVADSFDEFEKFIWH
jgi:hypothetical protein